MAKVSMPEKLIQGCKSGCVVWLGRLAVVALLLLFGYVMAYMVRHWQAEDFTRYIPQPTPVVDISTLQHQLDDLRQAVEGLTRRDNATPPTPPALEPLALRVEALEGLQGTVGHMAQIFLGQQLVMLDGAYRNGGDLLPAIMHVRRFAAEVSKNTGVAEALDALQRATPLDGPVTLPELVLTAEALYDMAPVVPVTDASSGWWGSLVASLKRWVKVTSLDDMPDQGLAWRLAVNDLRFRLAHGDPQVALALLNQPPFEGVAVVEPFRQGVAQYLAQQQAWQDVQRAFSESYKP